MYYFDEWLEKLETRCTQYSIGNYDVIYVHNSNGREAIAKKYPNLIIENHGYEENDFWIEICLVIGDRECEISVKMQENMRLKIEEDVLKVYKEKWIINGEKLRYLIEKFIKVCVRDYIYKNQDIYARCGWKKIDDIYEFKSVTSKGYDKTFIQNMFGGMRLYSTFDSEKPLSQDAIDFLGMLLSEEKLLEIYAYTIHSLLWDFKYHYQLESYFFNMKFAENPDSIFFSICLYGKDFHKARVIANVLSNLFNNPSNDWRIISNIHHLSATSVASKVNRLRYYSSVPVIVTSKNNHIIKSTKILKELYTKRRTGKLFIFPVYINDTAINVDEMLNIGIDDIKLPFDVKDKDAIWKMHHGALELLYYFLLFLRELGIQSAIELRDRERVWTDIRKNVDEDVFKAMKELNISEKEDAVWLQDNLPTFLLYVALYDFGLFLNKIGYQEHASMLKRLYQKAFIDSPLPNDNSDDVQNSFNNREYLQCMDNMIKTHLNKQTDWLFEGNEPRGANEKCYYLLKSEWYKHFSKAVKKEGLPTISERNIVAILKQNHLLKMQKGSSANGVLRNKKYYLAILAEEFCQSLQMQSHNQTEPVQ